MKGTIDVFDPEILEKAQKRQPDQAWRIDSGRMYGLADGLEAVRQAAWKRLNTEAEVYEIYTAGYGIKTLDLVGKEALFAVSTLKRRIKESLFRDDRITGVSNFMQETNGRRVTIFFTVACIYGTFDLEKGVQI